MSKGRAAALITILGAILGLIAYSRFSGSEDAATPEPIISSAPDAGGLAPAGSLTTDERIQFWHERVERNPNDYISYTELAGAHLQYARETGDVESYTRAEAALKEALRINPKYEPAVTYGATVLYAKHDFVGALDVAEQVHLVNPGSAQALAVMGDTYLELGRYAEAASTYESLLQLSESPPVYSRLARLAQLHGRSNQALELMRRAADEAASEGASQESIAWYHLQLGHLYFNTGNMDASAREFQRSLRAFPDYGHALAGLAKTAAAAGDYDRAISLYSEVVARYPLPEHVAALGDVYRAAGRDSEAGQQYDLVLAIDELQRASGINTDLQMALFLADHDIRLRDALDQAEAAYDERPSIQAADAYAWALFKAGRHEEAAGYSLEALRLGTRDASMLFHAGMIQQALGNDERARDFLRRAIDTNPNFSLLYAEQASSTLISLEATVREQS